MDPKQPEHKSARASQYTQIYANNVMMTATNWDFLLEFGRIVESTPLLTRSEALIGVYMSPQHAKAFSKALVENIANYEKVFGEIVTEPKARP